MWVDNAEVDPVRTAGLSKTKPTGKEPVFVLNAKPECAVKIPESCQPPMSVFQPLLTFLPNILPLPNGRSYTALAVKKCVASKSEGPRHTLKFVASQTRPPMTVFATLE